MSKLNPDIGTWKLNLGKSTFPPGYPVPKEWTMVVSVVGDHVEATSTRTEANGSIMSSKCRFPEAGGILTFDGRAPAELADLTLVHAVVSPNEFYSTALKDGRQHWLEHGVISEDGKTKSATVTGRDSQGKSLQVVAVFDRQ
jgi:hypothetical protein